MYNNWQVSVKKWEEEKRKLFEKLKTAWSPSPFRMSHSESLFSLNIHTHGDIKKSIYESHLTTLQFGKEEIK